MLKKNIIKMVSAPDFDWSQRTCDIAKRLKANYGFIHFLKQQFAPQTIKPHGGKVPCEFVNIKTGQVIKAESVTDFCRKAQLYKTAPNAKNHINTALLKRKQGIYKNWTHLEFYNFLNQEVVLKDSRNNLYRETGLKLKYKLGRYSYKAIYDLLAGKRISLNGLYLKDTEIKGVKPISRFKKIYYKRGGQILCQEGTQGEFAEKYNISRHSICDLKYGKKAQVKGFEFYKGVEKDTRIIK